MKTDIYSKGYNMNESLISCENFLAIFVITFGWVQQQTHPKVMKKWSSNVQVIRGSFGKEILISPYFRQLAI